MRLKVTPARTAGFIALAAMAMELAFSLGIFNDWVASGTTVARAAFIFALLMTATMAGCYYLLIHGETRNAPPVSMRWSHLVDTLIFAHITFSFQILSFPLAYEIGVFMGTNWATAANSIAMALILGAAASWLDTLRSQTRRCILEKDSGARSANKMLILNLAFGAVCLGLLPVLASVTQHINWRKTSVEAEVINLAGRQRLLSQQIVLVADFSDESSRNQFRELIATSRNEAARLKKLTDRLALQYQLAPELRARLPENQALEELREVYLNQAELLLANPVKLERTSEVDQLQISTNAFLGPMDQAIAAVQEVSQHLRAAQNSANTLRVMLGPLVFLGIALGLFWPLLRLIRVQHAVLDESRREAEAAMVEARAASVAKGQFLATMSHEIRTPMNGVMGMLDILLVSNLNDLQREQATIARDSAQSLLTIINEVLDFSKLEAGKVQLETVGFRPRQLVNDTISLLSSQAQQRDLVLDGRIAANVPEWVRGDPTRVRQILVNLIGNALKFTREGSVHVECSFTSNGKENMLRFDVRDTGIGISAAGRSKLFQRFTQVDASTTRKFGGTGLGLAISHQLVDLMGGQIGVESELGEGSTFWFEIGVTITQEPTINSDAKADKSEPKDGLKILVAEDNVVNQKIITALLSAEQHVITMANNGAEALEAARNGSYDVVLMDIQMPVMDGIEATRAIRSLEKPYSEVPIVAVTANAIDGDRETYLAEGMNDYVSKPINAEDLNRAIRDCTDARCGEADAA